MTCKVNVALYNMRAFCIFISILTVISKLKSSPLTKLKECVTVPQICPNINVTYWLYTRWVIIYTKFMNNANLFNCRALEKDPHELNIEKPETITRAPFISDRPFEILIHGYTGWKDYSPNTEIRPGIWMSVRWKIILKNSILALFKQADYNVISVDYAPIVKEPCYLNAVQNVKVVANCTAQMIDYLVKHAEIDLKRFHVIGFSLGAHVTGLIAQFLQSGQLEHITGMY